jgi:hypothetical protein
MSDSREMMFPNVPDLITFPSVRQNQPGNNVNNNQTDSFDDLTNRFNQLKKN